jgi:lipoprotein NlpD
MQMRCNSPHHLEHPRHPKRSEGSPILSKVFFSLFLIIILAGCGERNQLAPVTDSQWQPTSRYSKTHTVRQGETLYAISFRYDTDFRHLALLNRLRPPYSLRIGQILNVQSGRNKRFNPPRNKIRYSVQKSAVVPQKIIHSPIFTRSSSGWLWPVSGRVVATFVPDQGKKGINIACTKGSKIRASSSGVVAYSGNGLVGYGNLIIIKHNNEFLTAYANNGKNLVSEGQRVNSGQVIAEVGVIDRQYWGVHFEIRKAGIPVNPLNYLQKG